jgi:hypothetical protein
MNKPAPVEEPIITEAAPEENQSAPDETQPSEVQEAREPVGEFVDSDPVDLNCSPRPEPEEVELQRGEGTSVPEETNVEADLPFSSQDAATPSGGLGKAAEEPEKEQPSSSMAQGGPRAEEHPSMALALSGMLPDLRQVQSIFDASTQQVLA